MTALKQSLRKAVYVTLNAAHIRIKEIGHHANVKAPSWWLINCSISYHVKCSWSINLSCHLTLDTWTCHHFQINRKHLSGLFWSNRFSSGGIYRPPQHRIFCCPQKGLIPQRYLQLRSLANKLRNKPLRHLVWKFMFNTSCNLVSQGRNKNNSDIICLICMQS